MIAGVAANALCADRRSDGGFAAKRQRSLLPALLRGGDSPVFLFFCVFQGWAGLLHGARRAGRMHVFPCRRSTSGHPGLDDEGGRFGMCCALLSDRERRMDSRDKRDFRKRGGEEEWEL